MRTTQHLTLAIFARLPIQHQLVALALLLALLVAEYQGPIIAIFFAIGIVSMACLAAPGHLDGEFPSPVAWLLGILTLGCIGAVAANLTGTVVIAADLQRDLGMIASYALFLTVGFSLARRRDSYILTFSCVALAGVIISAVQLVRFGQVVTSGVSDLYLFRLEAGRGSITQFAALCACYGLYRELERPATRSAIIISATLIATSIVTTLSRGLLLFLCVLLLGLSAVVIGDRARVRISVGRGSTAVALTLAAAICAYFLLAFISPATRDFIDSSFVTRLTNSVTEVSTSNLQSRNQVIENYRAYELDRTLAQFVAQPEYARVIGQGWGATVNFGFDTASTTSSFRRVSAAFLHNGYAYYLMKTGLLGVGFYAAFLLHLVMYALRRSGWSDDRATASRRKILLVVAVGLGLGTVTTGGLGFPANYLGLVVVAGASLQRTRITERTLSLSELHFHLTGKLQSHGRPKIAK